MVQRFGAEGGRVPDPGRKGGAQAGGDFGNKVQDALKAVYQDKFEVRRVEMVGPKVGHDLRRKALMAIFYVLVMIAVYISGRFEAKWMPWPGSWPWCLVGAILLVQALVSAMGGGEDAGPGAA